MTPEHHLPVISQVRCSVLEHRLSVAHDWLWSLVGLLVAENLIILIWLLTR